MKWKPGVRGSKRRCPHVWKILAQDPFMKSWVWRCRVYRGSPWWRDIAYWLRKTLIAEGCTGEEAQRIVARVMRWINRKQPTLREVVGEVCRYRLLIRRKVAPDFSETEPLPRGIKHISVPVRQYLEFLKRKNGVAAA